MIIRRKERTFFFFNKLEMYQAYSAHIFSNFPYFAYMRKCHKKKKMEGVGKKEKQKRTGDQGLTGDLSTGIPEEVSQGQQQQQLSNFKSL